MILAIDPGPVNSAIVLYDPRVGLCEHYLNENHWLLGFLRGYPSASRDVLVIEQIASMGMAVGETVFETCFWSGRFAQAWGRDFERLKRVPVKLHLCGQARAKDANVRQALIDRFGGPACIRKGGALYRVRGDCWAALAVAVTYADTHAASYDTGAQHSI